MVDPDKLTGMSFDEIAEKYGEEAAIHAGIASDPEWGPEELDMSDARPAVEVAPHIVERWRRTRGEQVTPDRKGRQWTYGCEHGVPPDGRGIGEDVSSSLHFVSAKGLPKTIGEALLFLAREGAHMNTQTVDQDFVRESWEDADHARDYVEAVDGRRACGSRSAA